MTPTELIYWAWTNTPRPIIYHTSDGKGNPIKAECNFLDPLKHKKYDTNWKGHCLICGAESQGGIPFNAMRMWQLSGHCSGRLILRTLALPISI